MEKLIQNPQSHFNNCKVCSALFKKRTWNSSVCSSDCRQLKEKSAQALWYYKNKESENAKAKKRSSLYSKEELKNTQRRSRKKLGKAILLNKGCFICKKIFMPKSHNSKTCSSVCALVQDRLRNNAYTKNKYKNDINYKLAHNLRNRLSKVINCGSAVDNLGCTICELKTHLETQFQTGMTWDNYGKWHVDHIKPLSRFNLQNMVEFNKACHYANLQPLWAKDNLIKGNKEK